MPAAVPTAADLRVRLFGLPETVTLVQVNDTDRPSLAIDRRGATVRAIGARRQGAGDISVLLSQEGATPLASAARSDTIGSVDVTLRAGLDRTAHGWQYRGDAIRIGGPWTLTTENYTLRGILLGIDAASQQRGPEQ